MPRLNLSHFANPTKFDALAARLIAPLGLLAVLTLAGGLFLALFASPPDYQQGETVRIMYVHVPAAWLAMIVYGMIGLCSLFFLVWKHTLADVAARAAAPLGMGFAALCLITGSIWGRPMWGAWWVWDARLTSMLLLFFLYAGYVLYCSMAENQDRFRKAAALLALFGCLNLPIIKFSVDWWNTLHQPASVLRANGPHIAPSMLWPLLVMALGFLLLFISLLLLRMRTELASMRLRRLQMRRGMVEGAAL